MLVLRDGVASGRASATSELGTNTPAASGLRITNSPPHGGSVSPRRLLRPALERSGSPVPGMLLPQSQQNAPSTAAPQQHWAPGRARPALPPETPLNTRALRHLASAPGLSPRAWSCRRRAADLARDPESVSGGSGEAVLVCVGTEPLLEPRSLCPWARGRWVIVLEARAADTCPARRDRQRSSVRGSCAHGPTGSWPGEGRARRAAGRWGRPGLGRGVRAAAPAFCQPFLSRSVSCFACGKFVPLLPLCWEHLKTVPSCVWPFVWHLTVSRTCSNGSWTCRVGFSTGSGAVRG